VFTLMKDTLPSGDIQIAIQYRRHRFLGISQVMAKLKCLSNSSRSRDSEDLRHKRRVNDHVWRDGVVAECMHPCIARTQR
jgi:hypothetical protein